MKKKIEYVCSECGEKYLTWAGKCSNCGQWGTIEERAFIQTPSSKTITKAQINNIEVKKLNEIVVGTNDRYLSGISEFDRVLGGGLVKDSISILTAKPE